MIPMEATEKWCPFTRFHATWGTDEGANAAGNRVGGDGGTIKNPSECRCIAWECMAWRWQTDFNDLVEKNPEKDINQLKEIAHGYCGLAGKP